MYEEFKMYLTKYINGEELIFTIILLLVICVIGFILWQGERYNKILESAHEKVRKGIELTKKEQKIWNDYTNYTRI